MKVLLLMLRSIDQMCSVIETMLEITKHGKCGVPSASAVDLGHIIDYSTSKKEDTIKEM